ncbi:hypothetical protein AGIG_G21726 [Arapaima gigas]
MTKPPGLHPSERKTRRRGRTRFTSLPGLKSTKWLHGRGVLLEAVICVVTQRVGICAHWGLGGFTICYIGGGVHIRPVWLHRSFEGLATCPEDDPGVRLDRNVLGSPRR